MRPCNVGADHERAGAAAVYALPGAPASPTRHAVCAQGHSTLAAGRILRALNVWRLAASLPVARVTGAEGARARAEAEIVQPCTVLGPWYPVLYPCGHWGCVPCV